MEAKYRPIACDFHDRLEAFATLRTRVRLTLSADPPEGGPVATHAEGLIADLYTTAAKAEFLRLENGEIFRLDRILAIAPAV